MTETKNIQWILICKGLATILVVFGHFNPSPSPLYWSELIRLIYAFHMPLFFVLSGYLFNANKYQYSELVKTKVRRLLYPFISIALIFFAIKFVAGLFVTLSHPIDLHAVLVLLTDPMSSYMPLLWFVYVLFLIFIMYPLLKRFIDSDLVLLSLFVVLNTLAGGEYPVVGWVLHYIPYFLVGQILRNNTTIYESVSGKTWKKIITPAALFLMLYVVGKFLDLSAPYDYPFKFSVALLGVIAAINLSFRMELSPNTQVYRALKLVGYYSMSIYLFHTLFESAVRIGFYQVFSGVDITFELVAVVAIICGVLVPMGLERWVFRRYSLSRRAILGLS